ncbi:NlpC/P60 family protein [Anaerovirgula multivorans]|uniref:NlpC/P60 family protein n=1 Tax=Anaerovirgula multivorans TaxID=312168 RepID=A0A239AHT9_9FIRM|nr:NlpC/P60 family protein [Anaerovirgula multivorans]SNR95100.1 NlpC/P60 family protein [Anaerovirgula multivorans]
MNVHIDQQQIQELIQKYEDVPFVHNGRSLEEGFDCLGFVIAFYREFGIHLPSDDGKTIEKDWYKTDSERLVRGLKSVGGLEVSIHELQPLDLVYFAINRGIVTHTGIMISDNEFLHMRPLIGLKRASLDGKWQRRFRGAVRF